MIFFDYEIFGSDFLMEKELFWYVNNILVEFIHYIS